VRHNRGVREQTAWPNLFLVGPPRTATTSLWAALSHHPEIFMSRLKEPHYFTRIWPKIVPTVKYEREYLPLFAEAGDARYRGEASPSYFTDPISAPAIHGVSPAARIVVSLRDPVERAYSHYLHLSRYGVSLPPFLELVQHQLAERHPYWEMPIVLTGRYAQSLRRWRASFDGQLHVMFFEDFVADQRREVRRILEFLGVDTAAAETLPLERRNPGRLPRNPLLRRLYGARRLRRLAEGLVPRRLHATLERAALQTERPPEMDPEARRLLGELYDSEREELEQLVGRPLPWRAG
jgi:hypothetical protein